MKTFNATKVAKDEIELTSSKDLEDFYEYLEKEENFILKWNEGTVTRSEIKRGADIKSKVINGDMNISAKEPRGGK